MIATATIAHFLDTTIEEIDYQPETYGGNCFLNAVPASPNTAVSVFAFGGTRDRASDEADATWQIRVRGESDDPETPYQLIMKITDALYDIPTPTLFAAGTDNEAFVVMVTIGEPYFMGYDESDRGEWAVRATLRYSC
jgi:hypothetical protein